LTTCLEIPFEHALELTKKINLNLMPAEGDTYTVNADGETFAYAIQQINEVAACRVQDIAEKIKLVIDTSPYDLPETTEILLTGRGLTMAGAKEIVQKVTSRQVKYNTSDAIINLNKPNNCSLVGLLLYQKSKLPQKSQNKLIKAIQKVFDGRKK
ncbi:MAG: hypothetical protein PHI19_07705, partial [Clostridia bacterium]|nr:hypothetical protein [Clostridia bacterium]